ncbi:MAG: hypothetical protein KIS87_05395 [Phycisphaeraceae bacterium]|nr:hypothetical protein [Phycisphaeraceae bacterium]
MICHAPELCLDLDRVQAIAHRQACRLTGRKRLDEDGRDLRSELVLAALERWPRYEPERGRPTAFLAISMANHGRSVLRRQRAAKRGGNAVTVSVSDVAPSRLLVPGRSREELVDLAHDVRVAVEALPPDLASVCREYLGGHRTTLGDAAPALRERFESLGLKEYLP